MRIVTRARGPSKKVPHRRRAADFDRAVAEFFMRIALEEAAKGQGRTHPNPVVGAILVKGGRIVARGHHKRAGTAHAEIVALEAAGRHARGADLYTTLEPCDHWGRTPPCSRALLDAGVKRVICGSADPNPLVNGKGVARLRRAGVEVVTGVLEDEADALNRPFFKLVRTGLPWVTLKAAVTLDGKLAARGGDSRWVTGPEARARVHKLRDTADVILVGVQTARVDDPQLTTRLPQGRGRDPLRVVLDSRLRAPPGLRMLHQRSPASTIIATTVKSGASRKVKALEAAGAEVWTLPANKQGHVELRPLLERLGQAGHFHVLVEGGAEVFGSFLREGLADELCLFIAPKLVGGEGLSWVGSLGVKKMADALALERFEVEHVGPDLLVRALF